MDIDIPFNNKIIALAVDIWKLEEKIKNIKNIDDTDQEKVSMNIKRIKRFIDEYKIVVKGYTGEKYSDEVNAYELKGVEETNDIEKSDIIKNTIEPAVFIDEKLMKTGKIIVYKITS